MSVQIKFMLAHPSYGRPEKAAITAKKWLESAFSPGSVSGYFMCVEKNEEAAYASALSKAGIQDRVRLVSGIYGTCVSAANEAARFGNSVEPSWDVVILVSDDFECPGEWDEILGRSVNMRYGEGFREEKYAVQVSDGAVKHILTIPIISRAAYMETGYVYHPSYISMYADNDLREVFDRHFAVIDCTDTVFRHMHWANGIGTKDSTYMHQERPQAWNVGREVFEKRKSNNFPVK